MQKLLTISVASYNIEQYMDKMITSIIEADVPKEIEVLIVNDGSSDRTAAMALDYEKKYPEFIKLVNKENGGHGSTINKGIELASGKYFRALDGDDWLNSTALKELVRRLPEINDEVILSNYCRCYEDGRNKVVEFEGLADGMSYTFEEIASIVEWMRYHTVIYKTSILIENMIRLDEHCFYVDTEFMLLPIPYVHTIYYYEDYLYCYRLGLSDQSVSAESRRKNIGSSMKVSNRLFKFYHSLKKNASENTLSEEKWNYIINGISSHCIWTVVSLLLFPISRKRKADIIRFEKRVLKVSPDLYQAMQNKGKYSRSINALRKSGYRLYPLVSFYKSHTL